jgi:hypothetical protein
MIPGADHERRMLDNILYEVDNSDIAPKSISVAKKQYLFLTALKNHHSEFLRSKLDDTISPCHSF